MSTLQDLFRILDTPYWNEIEPLLYLGSMDALQDVTFMKTRVKAVVSITMDEQNIPSHVVAHLDLCLRDHDDADITQYFRQVHAFISEHIAQGHGVLVHCAAGRSRSATLVAAYLMLEYQWPATKALQLVKERRPCIQPNEGFLQQLINLEKAKK